MTTYSLTEQIEGSTRNRVIREFLTNSGIFPLFNGIRTLSVEGPQYYFTELPYYLLFLSAVIQAWFIGTRSPSAWKQRALGNLIAPALYTLVDMPLEGAAEFLSEPYHWVFWIFAIGMTIFYLLEGLIPDGRAMFILLMNLWRVMLFPILYGVSELSGELEGDITGQSLRTYLSSSDGHQFILMAAILFGLLLGFQEIQTDHYLTVLRRIASYLKNVSEWALAPDLLAASLNDEQILQQRRVQRAVLFMDIRGFTRWSESKDPETVVNMLNQFYQLAESIIMEGGGHKPHFIGDEVMTWFDDPEQAVLTARLLSRRVNQMLRPYQLSTGAGLHLGDVVEGLMGSPTTRSYNILGDTVNTASRLVSAAQPGELLISESVAQALTLTTDLPASRPIRAKGKAQPIMAYAV